MIYLNNAADSFPKLGCVNDFLSNQEYFLTGRECNCQTDSRKKVTEVFRLKIKEILNLPDNFQVTITHGATESANLVIQSFFKQSQDNDFVVCDHACHNSVIRPCYELYGNYRCFIHNNRYKQPCRFDDKCLIDICTSEGRQFKKCQMVIFSYESNVTGSLMVNVRELLDFISKRSPSTAVILDITQAIGNTKIDISELLDGIDYQNLYIFGTTHKSLGSISGTGFLIHPVDNKLIPLIYGGTGIGDHRQPREFPHYLESGTYNITSIACANKALDYSMSFMDVECLAKAQLVKYFTTKFNKLKSKSVKKYVKLQTRFINPSSGIINLFPINETVGEFITTSLFKQGFVTRFGCHCCSKFKYFDNDDVYKMSIRISFNSANTNSDIDKFFDAFSNTILELASNDR